MQLSRIKRKIHHLEKSNPKFCSKIRCDSVSSALWHVGRRGKTRAGAEGPEGCGSCSLESAREDPRRRRAAGSACSGPAPTRRSTCHPKGPRAPSLLPSPASGADPRPPASQGTGAVYLYRLSGSGPYWAVQRVRPLPVRRPQSMPAGLQRCCGALQSKWA